VIIRRRFESIQIVDMDHARATLTPLHRLGAVTADEQHEPAGQADTEGQIESPGLPFTRGLKGFSLIGYVALDCESRRVCQRVLPRPNDPAQPFFERRIE
jgi:hypothetical protein